LSVIEALRTDQQISSSRKTRVAWNHAPGKLENPNLETHGLHQATHRFDKTVF
jgi:hypothetical protein